MTSKFISKLKFIYICIRDVFVSDLIYALPLAIKWVYRTQITGTIQYFPLTNIYSGVENKGCLYLHSNAHTLSQKNIKATILLHGRHSHSFVMLHLADAVQKTLPGPIFSIDLHYDFTNPDIHRDSLKQAFETITQLVQQHEGSLNGLIATGHSLGAIELAYQAFVNKDKRILAVISIAGRLKLVSWENCSCREDLKPTIEVLYSEIMKQPNTPLYQIAGALDWNAPIEATIVRPLDNYYHIVKKGMHLNTLYLNEAVEEFQIYLKKITKTT